MASEITVRAPAKLNFGLRVLPRRHDGFHNIESIFQKISLCDDISVRARADAKCVVSAGKFDLPEENTLTLAFKAFRKVAKIANLGVDVLVKKNIPSGGGLGGGSSDAASLVFALEKISGIALSLQQKREIAALVGSDVFFFLEADSGCAVVSGRGEVVRPIEPRSDLHLLLLFPDVHSGTKEAYALVDAQEKDGVENYPSFSDLENVYRKPVADWNFKNTFTPAICGKYPEVAAALEDVNRAGAAYSEMSGSGSVVYGVFDTAESVSDAFRGLSGRWKGCVTALPCG